MFAHSAGAEIDAQTVKRAERPLEEAVEPSAISVIICTHNRAASLVETLRSLAQMAVPAWLSWELLVVDNNSTDGTRKATEEFATISGLRVRYLFEARQGKSFALNAGIVMAKGQILAFTDDDVQVDRNWLSAMWHVFEASDCIGVGGRIVATWNRPKPTWLEEEGPYRLMAVIVKFDLGEDSCALEVPPFGANMAFKRVAFEKYGLFRVDLGPGAGRRRLAGGEDTEIGRRMMSAGEKLIYAPDAMVFHPVEPHRARRRYFQTWYFNYGRAEIRCSGWTSETRRYFGIPRYLFRELATDIFRWCVSFNRKRRFYYKLQAYLAAGAISEARELARNQISH